MTHLGGLLVAEQGLDKPYALLQPLQLDHGFVLAVARAKQAADCLQGGPGLGLGLGLGMDSGLGLGW